MAKFVGKIGFMLSEDRGDGMHIPSPREFSYRGDLLQNNIRRNDSAESINDDLSLSNRISIVANPYAKEHIFEMTYVKFQMPKIGGIWKIESVEVLEPRIILTLGGVYSGITADAGNQTEGDSGQ